MSVFSARSFWLPVMLATLVAAFFGAVLARRGRYLERLERERAELRARLEEQQQENRRLRARRDALLSSPEAVERVAREEYGFAAPGEIADEGGKDESPIRVTARQPEPDRAWRLEWRDVSLLLPASVFLLTAFAFALFNLLSRPDSPNAD
ncbi:MAG: FtsB family cell division protein [Planctomycetota bacterium]